MNYNIKFRQLVDSLSGKIDLFTECLPLFSGYFMWWHFEYVIFMILGGNNNL